ncbi:MAG TPA: AsnC family protein [Phycicoccus sp.]|nr:AsnC family protein [Phycicoccus sp.]HRA44744.1 AsnC family protein [Phycicoccus sp.]
MRPSLSELIAKADQLADQFENYEPTDDDLNAPLPPLMSVKLAQFRRAQAEKELAEAIHAARDAKISWRELGEAIGTSGEAVRQRYAS